MGPLLDAKFADRFEEYLTWIQPHHMVYGATGRISAENPRDGFVGDPGAGLYYHPVVVDGVRSDDRIFAEETFGPIVGVASYGSFTQALELANAPGYGLSSAIYTSNPKEAFAFASSVGAGMVSINNSTSGSRGTPTVRRQREVGKWFPAIGNVGARPVHSLAGGQLGLLRPAAAGADGHRGTYPGHRVSPVGHMHPLDVHFRTRLSRPEPIEEPRFDQLTGASLDLWALFEAQATSRHLDFAARTLQQQGRGFYTIGSAGHESNAMIALATRPTDPALLHYRSGGFYVARAGQLRGTTPVRDVLQGLLALADEPIAGGRHKVFGHPRLAIIPQTSTVASHLPRAVGLAVALHRAHRLDVECEWPSDAVVICSFGDASANHSTAAGAINTAIHTAYGGLPVPILFVCEDNGFGISVPTPAGWIESAYGSRPGLRYFAADGVDPLTAWPVISEAVDFVRGCRQPAFLHLKTVRFGGHAGSDAEISYRRPRDIEADYDRDPLLATANRLRAAGVSAKDVLASYDQIRAEVEAEVERLQDEPRLRSAAEVMAPLAPRRPEQVAESAVALGADSSGAPRTLAESINATLRSILAADQRVLVFGEDVGVKGGVYGVTRGLARTFGAARVFDTVLDEQSILGLGLGAGLAGLIPMPEIQYLAYLHNAEDQLRGEAATLPFFSTGRFRNPMVVRIAGLAYQKGFGGHFHNDNALGVLSDIPGSRRRMSGSRG